MPGRQAAQRPAAQQRGRTAADVTRPAGPSAWPGFKAAFVRPMKRGHEAANVDVLASGRFGMLGAGRVVPRSRPPGRPLRPCGRELRRASKPPCRTTRARPPRRPNSAWPRPPMPARASGLHLALSAVHNMRWSGHADAARSIQQARAASGCSGRRPVRCRSPVAGARARCRRAGRRCNPGRCTGRPGRCASRSWPARHGAAVRLSRAGTDPAARHQQPGRSLAEPPNRWSSCSRDLGDKYRTRWLPCRPWARSPDEAPAAVRSTPTNTLRVPCACSATTRPAWRAACCTGNGAALLRSSQQAPAALEQFTTGPATVTGHRRRSRHGGRRPGRGRGTLLQTSSAPAEALPLLSEAQASVVGRVRTTAFGCSRRRHG
jgi:hypothetical protein